MDVIKPQQTYLCDFHDTPLVMEGWRGRNVSKRRYTMRDEERGTIIEGIRDYARKCTSLPMQPISPERKSQLEKLKWERDCQVWWNLLYLFLAGGAVYLSATLQVWFDDKERQERHEQFLKRRREEREEKDKARKEWEGKLTLERERSRKALQSRRERKKQKREDLERKKQ